MSGKPVTDSDGGVFDIPNDPSPANSPSPASPASPPSPGMSWSDALNMSLSPSWMGVPLSGMAAPLLGDAPAIAAHANARPDDAPAELTQQAVPTQPTTPTPPPTPPTDIPGVPHLRLPGFDFKGSQKRLDDATNQQAKGAMDAAAADAEAARIRAQSKADVASQQQQYFQQSQAARDAAYQQTQAKMADVQKQMEEAGKDKVDPNHFWATRSSAQAASAALGLAFSQMGAAFTHTQPVDLISQAIDRDIAAQRDNIANRRAGLQQQAGLLEQNYRIFGNYQDAADMTKAHMLEGLAAQGEAQAQQAGIPAIAARAQQVSGQLRQQAEELKQNTATRQSQMAYQNNMLALDEYKARIEAAQMGMQRQMMLGQKGLTIGGQTVYIPDDKQREKIASMLEAGKTLKTATQENADVAGKLSLWDRFVHTNHALTGGLIPDTAPYAQMNAAQEAAAVSSNKALGSDQAQTEQQYKNMRETLNTPNNPTAARKAGKMLSSDSQVALYQQLAQIPTIGPQRAAQLVLSEYPPDAEDQKEAQDKYLATHGAK